MWFFCVFFSFSIFFSFVLCACFFSVFLVLVAINRWIDATSRSRSRSPHPIHRRRRRIFDSPSPPPVTTTPPPPPPVQQPAVSPSVIDLTSQHAVAQINVQPSTSAAVAQINVQPSTSNAQPSGSQQQLQTSSSRVQDELQRITNMLSVAYVHFLRLFREEMTLNNNGERLNQMGSFHHRNVMSLIDRHFLDVSTNRIVDPQVSSYVLAANTDEMHGYDRTRINLVKLELENNRFHIRKERLKRLRVNQRKQASCPVCLEVFRPSLSTVYPNCGHVVCSGCMTKIRANPQLNDRCAVCRVAIYNQTGEDLSIVRFMFNHDSDAICRFCERPFESDTSDVISCVENCEHAFHKNCLQFNQQKCCICPGFNPHPPKTIFLQFN